MSRLALPAAALAAVFLFGAAGAANAQHTDPEAPDWPCIQRKVPELFYGQMWTGQPLDDYFSEWRRDAEVNRLVPVLVARRTPMDEARTLIQEFAENAGDARNERLTMLFAGVFQRLNAERSRVMAGIERYAVRQRDLAEKIKEARIELNQMRGGERPSRDGTVATPRRDGFDATPEDLDDNIRFASDLDEQVYWDTRIYDERNRALVYVCDSPVILEQRAFSMAREIGRLLD